MPNPGWNAQVRTRLSLSAKADLSITLVVDKSAVHGQTSLSEKGLNHKFSRHVPRIFAHPVMAVSSNNSRVWEAKGRVCQGCWLCPCEGHREREKQISIAVVKMPELGEIKIFLNVITTGRENSVWIPNLVSNRSGCYEIERFKMILN